MATPLKTGDRVIDFELRSVDGMFYSSEDARRQGLLLFVFWKKTCGTCQYSFPFFQRFHDQYAGDRFQIWGIAQENELDARDFAKMYGATFPQLLDDDLEVSERYDLAGVPAMYLVDRSDAIVESTAGFSTEVHNSIARRAAERTGKPYVPIVRPDDNAPIIQP